MKAIEFWIEEKRMGTTAWAAHTIKSNPPQEQFKECFIHVIEYSAYEEIKRQLKAQVELTAEFDDRIGELQRQNEIMAEALEEIAIECHPNLTNKDTIFHNKRAREALSKCGKGGSV